jgi:hypothetical protein
MTSEAPQIVWRIRWPGRKPARDVQPAIVSRNLGVDQVLPVLRGNPVSAQWPFARLQLRFCPFDRLADILGAKEIERHFVPREALGVDIGLIGLLPERDAVGIGNLGRFVVVVGGAA